MASGIFRLLLYFILLSSSISLASHGDDHLHKLTPDDGSFGDFFGNSVAISGSIAVVGSRWDDDNGVNSGSAYVFDVSTGNSLLKLKPKEGEAGSEFGQSVGIYNSIAIAGAPYQSHRGTETGAAYLFNIATGEQLFELRPQDVGTDDEFGRGVAIHGTTAIVGSNSDDDNGFNSGSAYIYDVTSGDLLHKITPNDGGFGDRFGLALDLDDSLAIIGAHGSNVDGAFSSGAAYLFETTTGNQLFKLVPDDGAKLDQFGVAVAVNGELALVGSPLDDDNGTNSGSAYLFDVTTGNQLLKLTPEDGAEGDFFGDAVAVTDKIAIIGAPNDDDNGFNSGSTYLFDLATGKQLLKLTAGDLTSRDEFGKEVAISGSTAIVGTNSLLVQTKVGTAYFFKVPEPSSCAMMGLYCALAALRSNLARRTLRSV